MRVANDLKMEEEFNSLNVLLPFKNGWSLRVDFVLGASEIEIDEEYVLNILSDLKDIIETFGMPIKGSMFMANNDDEFTIEQISYYRKILDIELS